MAIFNKIFSRRDKTRSLREPSLAGDIGWYGNGLGVIGGSGPVSPDTAMQLPAFACAVRLLTDEIASLPVRIWRESASAPKEMVKGSAGRILNYRWSDELTAFQAKRRLIYNAIMYRGGFAYIERVEGGRVARGLHVLDPWSITRYPDYFAYRSASSKGIPARIPHSDVIEIYFTEGGYGSDYGFIGRSALEVGQSAIRAALYAQQFTADYFNRGAVPDAVITTPDATASTAEQLASYQADLETMLRQMHSRGSRVAYMLPGTKIEPVGVDPRASQMVELLAFHVAEIGRLFNIPSQALHSTDSSSYSTVEQASLSLGRQSIAPWTRQLEQQITAKFLPLNQYCEFDISRLVRADFKTLGEGLARRVHAGLITPNEAREFEGRPRSEQAGADDLMMQGATSPLGEASNGLTPDADPDNGQQERM